jgi:hypothetical protein
LQDGGHPHMAVQGEVVREFGHEHMSQQGLGRHPAGDRPFGRGSLHYRFRTGSAAVARAPDHLDPQLGGDEVEHLARVLTDHVQATTTAGATLVLDVDQHLDPRQVRRQGAQVASPDPRRPRGAVPRGHPLLRRLGRGQGLLEVLEAEL